MLRFPMYVRNIQLYGQLIISRHCKQVTYMCNERAHSTEKNISQKFPAYDIIYVCPYINNISILNRTKRNLTAFTGLSILTSTGLQLLDFISIDQCLEIVIVGSIFTMTLHAVTLMCNNMIGYIYFKEKSQEIVLSYSNYWGERIDLKTDVQNILPLSETPLNVSSYVYRSVKITSCKKKLKLTTVLGQIVRKDHFSNIFYP